MESMLGAAVTYMVHIKLAAEDEVLLIPGHVAKRILVLERSQQRARGPEQHISPRRTFSTLMS